MFDQSSQIKAIVTPYFPNVVRAIARLQQLSDSSDDLEVRNSVNLLLKDGAGLYIDWENNNRLVNARGNYYQNPSELDSLLFLITLRNQSWPCNVPQQTVEISPGKYAVRPLMNPVDWPCYIPDIIDLDRRILLQNSNGDSVLPKFVWGRRNAQLTLEEHIFVLFDFSSEAKRSFLKGSKMVTMIIAGFNAPIRFDVTLNDF